MIRVYGYSDDTVEVEGAPYPADEIACYDKEVEIQFDDETVIRIGYPKENLAVWWIKVLKHGLAVQHLEICEDQDAEIYSDVFTINSYLAGYRVCEKERPE